MKKVNKPFLQDFAKAIRTEPIKADKSFYGVVKEIVEDESGKVRGYKISLGGEDDIIECRKFAGADVGDTVMVTLMANGTAVVTGRRDGDGDAIEAVTKAEEADIKAQSVVDRADRGDFDGKDGRGIASTTVEYALSNDGNTAPVTGWQSTVPTPTSEEPYIWTRTHIVYTSGEPAYSNIYSVSKDGQDGQNGRGISSIVEQWARGTALAPDSTSWDTTPPALTSQYPILWYRQEIQWTNPTETTYSPSASGVKSTMINELVTFRNLIANDGYTSINGSKIGAGTITLGGTANGDGLLEVYDSLNNLVAKLSKDENIFAGFNIKPTAGRYQGDKINESYYVESLIDYDKDFEIVHDLNIERYGFDGNRFFANHDEWYHSKNFGINNSVALSVIHLELEKATHVYMDVLDYQNEGTYDYGTVGTIDGTALSSSYSKDYTTVNSQVKWTGYNNHKQNGETIDFGVVAAGEHTIYVRYKKNSSTDKQNDCLYFRLFFGYEPALYYKDDNGSMMYISKSKIYQRNILTDIQGSNVSYSVFSWLLRHGTNSLQTLDTDYISSTSPVREGNWKSVHYTAFDTGSMVFQHDDEFGIFNFFKGEGSEPTRFAMDRSLEVGGDITVRSHSSPIGTIISKTGGTDYTSDLSSGADTVKNIASITLPRGTWIITARCRYTPSSSGNHYSSVGLTRTSQESTIQDRRYGTSTYSNQHNLSSVYSFNGDNNTIYLTGQASASGNWIRTSASTLKISAVRIR